MTPVLHNGPAIKRRVDRYVEMRAGDEIDKPTFLAKTDEANQLIQRMEKDLSEQRAKAAVLDGTHAARIVKAVQTLLAGRTRLTCDQKRAILNSIVRKIDVTTERTGALQQRETNGRCLAGKIHKYAITKVSITLALGAPTLAQEREERVGTGSRPNAAPNAPVGDDSRTGQLGTTYSVCGQVSGTEPGLRTGQKDTTLSNCGQVSGRGDRSRVGQKDTTFSCWVRRVLAKP